MARRSPHSGNAARAGRREWSALAVLALPCLLVAMDLTVLYLAVPALVRDLEPSNAQLLWITDVYGFLIAGALVTMGTLGDRVGRRRLLLAGAAAFGVASVLAALSTSAGMLIAARALLGLAGATLMPSTLSLIRTLFADPGQRTTAIGVWATSLSAGAAIGPLLGGVVLENFAWGAVFLLNVPVMALLLVLGPWLLPESRDPEPGRFDVVSAALSLVAVLAVVYGLKRVAEGGLAPAPLLLMAAGVAAGLVFVRRQTRLVDPLLDLRLFRLPSFSASLAANSLALFAILGIELFIAQYLQLVLGMGPLEAGLWSLPAAGGFIAGAMLAPALARRFRPASVVAAGLAVAAAGCILLTTSGTGLAAVVCAHVVLSIGLGPVVTLSTDLVVSAVPEERAGAASAISETGSELGGALGIALLGSLGTAVYRSELAGAPPLASVPDELLAAAGDAFTRSVHVVALATAAVLLGMAAVAARRLSPRSRRRPTTQLR